MTVKLRFKKILFLADMIKNRERNKISVEIDWKN